VLVGKLDAGTTILSLLSPLHLSEPTGFLGIDRGGNQGFDASADLEKKVQGKPLRRKG
jgi:hypothetical protein